MDEVKIGKFLSLILRHSPETVGIKLDEHGWANIDELLRGMNSKGYRINMLILEEIVKNNNKKRYSFNDDKTKIRANQGHSISVDVELKKAVPPDTLFHGTAVGFYDSILQNGLQKQGRNHVHLSIDMQTAVAVGKRHGRPVVFRVDARAMHIDGFIFYLSENGVWLTDSVPAKYLSEIK